MGEQPFIDITGITSMVISESHGQRNLVGCCPQGCPESETNEATQHACIHCRRKWQPTPVFLPGESQGQRSLVSCHLWGCTESDVTEATQQHQQKQIVDCKVPLSMGFSNKITRMGCCFLVQGIFLTQGLNPHLCISCTVSGFFTTEPAGKPTEVIRELKCLSI